MTKREAGRLALLVVANELRGSLDVSDEWVSHPETNETLSRDERAMIRTEGERFLSALEERIARMRRT
jgi:hypothetical protein